jgi:hypothetical protein
MQLFVDFGQKRKESLPIILIHQLQNHLQNIKRLNDNLHTLKPQFKDQSNHIVCVFYYENLLTNERKCTISFSTLVIAQPYKMVNSCSNVAH